MLYNMKAVNNSGGRKMDMERGGFTLPGEAGYEALTMEMAEKWGADVIRDSDGTKLSDEILNAGYGIYSTLCVIREHNEWAKMHPDKLQQTFLCTPPFVAEGPQSEVTLMESFFEDQFAINDSEDAMRYWQVYDRTINELLPAADWEYIREKKSVRMKNAKPWHKYTVSFMVYRIWEEISMYNHTTNHWDKEHLMQIDPRHKEVREYLLTWMEKWCEAHSGTDVVRFTSMFYNFTWIWGSSERNRHLFTDWGSYDYTVSPLALDEFEKKYGYSLTAEDFINQGKFRVTHMPADKCKMDYMEFINDFVIGFGKQLVDIVHSYGKKAYVFYDDSWVGIEPYNERFREFGFDGLIKCVFSGYEARLCAGVEVPIHELRLHPYLFPVGLGGAPTFMEGGDPVVSAKEYWINVRRALLREPIERIGLGGYLHLVEGYPDFNDYIEKVAGEFRLIQSLHKEGKAYTMKTKVAVLHSWGKLRSWSLSGHFHETYMHDLIHVNEALSGLPLEVSFLDFEDIKAGALAGIDVVLNVGSAGSAWSGGSAWKDGELIRILTAWVHGGGAFIGINEPSAVEGYDTYFRMAHVLGLDEDTGARVCHGRWPVEVRDGMGILPEGVSLRTRPNRYLTDGRATVLLAEGKDPIMTINDFGKGKGVYLSEFRMDFVHTRLLLHLVRHVSGESIRGLYMTDDLYTECSYYPESKKLVVINNSDSCRQTSIETENGWYQVELEACGMEIIKLI